MEITNIENLKNGDIILIEAGAGINVVTVETVDSGLIIPVEFGGKDILPEDPEQIVRLGTIEEKPTLIVMSQDISLGLSESWIKNFFKK